MSLRIRVLFIVAVIITGLICLFSLLLIRQQQAILTQVIQARGDSVRAVLEQRQSILLSQYRSRLHSFVAARPEITTPFVAADRETLLQQSRRLMEVLQRENPWFSALFFALPDNRILLRVHHTDQHGDDATAISPLIARANATKTADYDLEVIRGGLHFRLVHPVFENGIFAGLAGFGIDCRYLTDGLGGLLGYDVALVLPKSASDVMIWLGETPLAHNNHLLLNQHGSFFAQPPQELQPGQEQQIVRQGGREYVVLAELLRNSSGQELGRILLAFDVSAMLRDGRNRLLLTVGLGVLLLCSTLLLLYVVLGKLLRRNQELAESLRRSNETLEERVLERTKELEEASSQRRQAEMRAERAQRMEAIGLMAGGVAHDLNNILSGLTSYPEYLLLEVPADSPLRQPLESIRESGQRAAAVVADLLTVARGVASNKEPRLLNDIVQEYLASPETRRLVAENRSVTLTSELNATGACRCSSMHMQKVLMNLVTNAVEAMQKGGQVNIRTRDEVVSGGEGQRHPGRGTWVVLQVEDSGPGIAAQDLPHIFEPFYSRKKMGRSGTGLGLAVVWNAIQDHGGEIHADSSPAGTCFTVHLPACPWTDQEASDKNDEAAEENLQGRGQILVVDDEQMQRDVAARMLRTLGYTVETAASGEEALVVLQRHPVDLVLLDMLMDGMNGLDTYREMQRLAPHQKAIIVSGYSGSVEYDQARELGVACLLHKPYTMVQLGRTVRDVLGLMQRKVAP